MIGSVLFGVGIGGALVVAAYALAQAFATRSDRYEADGDWPYLPEVFPPHNGEGV